MASSDGEPEQRSRRKSRKPGNTAFKQQRLKAWQPILTPQTVLPLLFALGIVLGPIGGLMIWGSSKIQEISIDYTDCAEATGKLKDIPSEHVHTHFSSPVNDRAMWMFSSTGTGNDMQKTCTLHFSLPNKLEPPVFLYYRLTNFYQNHRRYVKSLDEKQLKGDARSKGALGTCSPLDANSEGKPYYPCGLIANSMFNDTFEQPVLLNTQDGSGKDNETYHMTNKGISWNSDRGRYGETKYKPDEVVPPPNWVKKYGETYTDETLPNLHDMEEFQVWMRTAGFPMFNKLAMRNDSAPMKRGTYEVQIAYNFPSSAYSGTKSLVISTSSVLGGRNPWLGITYVIVSGLCVLLGALFTASHLYKPRKLGDHTHLTFDTEPAPAQATTSGRAI
ncbi:ligand-effect modulator 3 family [Tuber brumale]|nr:ligand-effect modulator 3 family [Tuber brumale]